MSGIFQQFTDLFLRYPDALKRLGSDGALEDFLRSADIDDDGTLRRYKSMLREMMAPDYGVNLNAVKSPLLPAAAVRRTLPDFTKQPIACVNDTYYLPETIADGRVACAMLKSVYSENNHYHLFSQFTDLFSPQELHIYVQPGTVTDVPLQINNILSATADLSVFRRVIVEVGESCDLKIIVNESASDTAHNFLVSDFLEFFVDEGSKVDIYDINATTDSVSRLNEVKVKLKRGCSLNLFSLSLSGGKSVNLYDIDFESDNSEACLYGFALGDGDRQIGNSTFVNHLSRRCKSNQNFKYVLDGRSRGTFYGEIFVWEVARFTEAYQSNKNIILSGDSRMRSEPQLLIYNDDVKCSHGATTGQLDESALFYMRQRGIPETVALTMLTQAFVGDVVDAIGFAPLRDRMRILVENRLYNRGPRPCDNCRMACNTLTDKVENDDK